MGPSGAASCPAGLLGNVGRRRKKEAYPPAGTSLQDFLDRSNYSCEEKTAGKYLQVLAPQTFSPRDDLCGQLHVVYPGRYTCGSILDQSLPVERRLI